MYAMSSITPSNRIAVLANALSTDARQAATNARSMGFGGLLFDSYSPTLSLPDLSQTGRREFRQVLAAQEVQLVGLGADLGTKGFGPGADVDRLIHQLDRAMESAAGLSAPLLCLDVGPLAQPERAAKPKPKVTLEQAGLLLLPTTTVVVEEAPPLPRSPKDVALESTVNAALAELGVRADRYSVMVAFRTSLASFAALEHAVASVRCPWFGIDLNPVSMLPDDWDADEIFSHLGALIHHVRGTDALLGTDRRTKPVFVGQGSVEWQALLARLDQSGYHRWLTIDPTELSDRPRAAGAALLYLQKLVR